MSAYLQKMQAAQEKKSASSRLTNVVCSTAIFPEDFEVAESPKMSRRSTGLPCGDATRASPSPTAGRRDPSVAESCLSDESGTSDAAIGTGSTAHMPSLTHVEHQAIVQQTQFNVELLKLKLFALLDMAVLPMEEEATLARMEELQASLASLSGGCPGHVGDVPSRPLSAAHRHSSNETPQLPSPAAASNPSTAAVSKLAQQTGFAVDSAFRYAFEEISLRWQSLQDRPFSLRAFHQVAREQVRLRQSAMDEKGKAQQRAKACEQEVEAVRFKLDNDANLHAQYIQTLLTENRVLRQRIMDLQLKMKLEEAIPQLFDPKHSSALPPPTQGVPSGSGGDAGGDVAAVDPNEKHYETLNRRLTEECALLSHTLEQRNGVVKALHAELQTTKSQAASVKDDFRKYVQEQEAMDVEFRRTFAQNETATENAKKESARAVKRTAEVELKMAKLSGEVEGLEASIAKLEGERQSAYAERDHLRSINATLVVETEAAKDALADLQETSAAAEAEAAEKLRVASARIFELENDGTREKLEAALLEIKSLSDKIKSLQRAVESRDRQIQTMKTEHKAEVNKLEERITFHQEELANATLKFEDMLVRERQKGVELADKKVAEANAVFDVERQELRGQLRHADNVLGDLAHEVMLFHRQSTILELFLRQRLDKDALRALAKLVLRRDIRNSVLEQGGESDLDTANANEVRLDSSHPSDAGSTLGHHTPRTRHYFGAQRLFDPEDIQQRLTHATEGMERPLGDIDDANDDASSLPIIPRHDQRAPAALLIKSKITLEFLTSLTENRSTADVDRVTNGNGAPIVASFIDPAHREEQQYKEAMELRRRRNPPRSPSSGDDAAAADLLLPVHVLHAQQQMVMDDLKSQLVVARMREKALEDEVYALKQGDNMMSAGFQTSFASNPSTSPRKGDKPRSAGKSRPSSGTSRSQRGSSGDESPGAPNAILAGPLGPNSSLGIIPGSMMIHRAGTAGSAGYQRSGWVADSKASSVIGDDDTASSVGDVGLASEGSLRAAGRLGRQVDAARQSQLVSLGGNPPNVAMHHQVPMNASGGGEHLSLYPDESAPFLLAREFPGLQHAAEFLDLFESFHSIRSELSALVGVCCQEAERGALHPNDLNQAQALLHAKFSIFRSVEAQNTAMLHRLHHKKEDVMRRREEELEKVLGAMQNISVTHPKESASLMRVAKAASRARQLRAGGRLRASDHEQHSLADGCSGTSMHELGAVVVRPVSQQSVRRLAPIPVDVVVSGAPALMSLRTRASSATPSRTQRKS